MSYPGAVGYPTNLGCETSLQRSTTAFNFVVDNGTTPSNIPTQLQSPASVVQEETGACSLTVESSTGGGNAVVEISNTTGNAAVLNLNNVASGLSVINMGELPNGVTIACQSIPSTLQLTVSDQATGTPYLTVDTGTAPNAGYVKVSGNGGTNNVFLESGSVASDTAKISSSLSVGGTLAIGSSSVNPNQIIVTDTTTSISNLALNTAPQTLLPAATYAAGTTTPFNAPTAQGLYMIMGATTVGTTGVSIAAQLSTILYVNAGGTINIGGATYAQTGAAEYIAIVPNPTTRNQLELIVTSGSQALVQFSVVAVKLSGPIAGLF